MGLFSNRRVRATRDGRFELRLPRPERRLLVDLIGQLRELLTAGTDEPSLRRLFPTAYHGDVDRDREYQQLARDELLEARLASLATVERTAEADGLDEAELSAWLTVLNDLRLVLGTRLDVSEELTEVGADDPDAPAYALYDYLGYVLSEVVDALAGALPPPPEGQV